MKKYRCYLRAIFLSIVAALVLDTAINYDECKEGWNARGKKTNFAGNYSGVPVFVGKITGAVYHYLLQK